MRQWVLLGCLAQTAVTWADEEIALGGRPSSKSTKESLPNIINLTPARSASGHQWDLFADVLYWHADIGNADWAWKNPNINEGFDVFPAYIKGENFAFNFKWDWGFKVGLGKGLAHDHWDTELYYTWFHTKNSQAIGTEPDQVLSDLFFPHDAPLNSQKLTWSIDFSMFDWELGKRYYISDHLVLRPHVGLKGGWIDQTRHHSFSELGEEVGQFILGRAVLTNDFWGIGFSAGLNSLWILGSTNAHRFSLFGDVSGAWMYGHFSNKCRTAVSLSDGQFGGVISIRDLDRNLASSMLQAILGISWDTPFNKSLCHFTFKAGYEFQFWYAQNQFPYIEVSTVLNTRYTRYNSDLNLQGLTFDFRFDF